MLKRLYKFALARLAAASAVAVLAVASANAATFTVSTLDDSGAGSLRDAIAQANSTAGLDTINFSLSAGTINLATPLPAITDPVNLIGGSQPSIELNGAATQSTGNASIGIYLRAGGSTIQGFVINRFGEAGIRMDSDGVGDDSGNIVRGNRIGTNTTGNSITCGTAPNTTACGNINRGILIVGTTNHQIGVTGVSGGSNLISGNQGRGIEITAGGSAIIRNNLIGTDINGSADLGNTSHGIFIANSSNSTIGGTAALNVDRNVISGNNGSGIVIIGDINAPASNNRVLNNLIGVTVTGNAELGNNGSGIVIQASNNVIGGTTESARNVISGNGANGISIGTSLATNNLVQGNLIGVGINNGAIPNADSGVQIGNRASGNRIGTASPAAAGTTCSGACNLIASNGSANSFSARAGVYVEQTAGIANAIRGNSMFANLGIGIDLDAPGATANDTNDPDTGANNIQNFPVLTAADTNSAIAGTLNSLANTSFAIDFYRNDPADAGMVEGRTYIGTANVTTNSGGTANIGFAPNQPLTAGQSITATATNLTSGGDTSEFSAAQTVTQAAAAAPAGIEADVSPRDTNGNGSVTPTDVVQIRRFFLGADPINTATNEFQRADCAPFETRGNGSISTTDIVQARRYFVQSDSAQRAGGATAPGAPRPASLKTRDKAVEPIDDRMGQSRTVRVVSRNAAPGRPVTVSINADAIGDEASYGFGITYDPNVFSNPVVALGSGATGGNVLSFSPTPGQINISVDFPNAPIPAGTSRQLVTIRFDVSPNAQPGSYPIAFATNPAPEVSNEQAQALPTTFTGGTVTINSTTAATATLGGRITTADGRALRFVTVYLISQSTGAIQTAATGVRGEYGFNAPVGDSYVVRAVRRGYVFEPGEQIVQHLSESGAINFTARQR